MCFGMNVSGAGHCRHCGRCRKYAGWTLWMHYDTLPTQWQAVVDLQYGPLILAVLRTKWPECVVEFSEPGAIPSL
jgi:hypothetical protein